MRHDSDYVWPERGWRGHSSYIYCIILHMQTNVPFMPRDIAFKLQVRQQKSFSSLIFTQEACDFMVTEI